ncbi:MAG: hypothetical protein FWC86_05050 [Coriobacteriia bacterium]|nr:hypothetical protein [Coriobacteriia bacterium]
MLLSIPVTLTSPDISVTLSNNPAWLAALFTAIALTIAVIANNIADKPNFPNIYIKDIIFDPKKTEIYYGENLANFCVNEACEECKPETPCKDEELKIFNTPNAQKIVDTELFDEIILKTPSVNKLQLIKTRDGKSSLFAFVNLCEKYPKMDNVLLILNAFEMVIACPKVTHIEIKAAYSAAGKNETFPDVKELSLSGQTNLDTQEMRLKFAYAFDGYHVNESKKEANPQKVRALKDTVFFGSHLFGYLRKPWHELTEIIGKRKRQPVSKKPSLNLLEICKQMHQLGRYEQKSLLADPILAGRIFNFVSTGYIIKCTTLRGDRYYYTVYLETSRYSDSRDEFDSYLTEAIVQKGISLFLGKRIHARLNPCVGNLTEEYSFLGKRKNFK